MSTSNAIMLFEGDTTQKLANAVWEKELWYPKKVRLAAGRVIFTQGDISPFWTAYAAYQESVSANLNKIAAFDLGAIYPAGGYPIGSYPLAGDDLEALDAPPAYAGDLALTLKIYSDDTLRVTKTLYNNEIFKFSAGGKKRRWKLRVEGNVDLVERIDLASTVDEIKQEQVEG